MKSTWRHHYIPVFYLKQFTSNEGKFKIYNVKEKSFIWNGKDFPPKSYFFKENDNSVFVGSEDQEILEDSFGNREDVVAKLFESINKYDNGVKFGINERDLPEVLLFISMIYYRNPNHQDQLLKIIDSKPLSDLGLKSDNGRLDPNTEKTLKESVDFQKIFKWLYPTIDLLNVLSQNKSDYISSYPEGLPKLCSDNPVIIRDGANDGVFSSDIIFPISPTRVYVRMKDKRDGYFTDSRLLIDVIIFMQAYDYVSCTDEKYIDIIKDTIETGRYTLSGLKEELFMMFEKEEADEKAKFVKKIKKGGGA